MVLSTNGTTEIIGVGMTRIKILFVDENREQLTGLQKLLADDSDRWELFFCEDGMAALDELAQGEFDVIVTDIDMPIIDGSQLLAIVRERYPSLIRIVFSHCSEQRKILRAAQMAHRYVPKPCSASTLRRTIENTLYIHVVLDNDAVRKVLLQTSSLPSVPSAYTKLMEKIDDPDFSVREAAEIISLDVGLTVNVLKQVNQFGFEHSITDIYQAVSLMGLDVIRAIALTTHIFHSIGSLEIPHFSMEKLMQESMLVALFAKQIMLIETKSDENADHAFIAGMLHRLGTLVFVVNFPDKYAAVLDRVYGANRPLIPVENNLIGISHPKIGAHLLALWGMPEPILNGVAFYREPAVIDEPNVGITTAVYAAYHLTLDILDEQDRKESLDLVIDEPFDYRTDSYLVGKNLTKQYSHWREECRVLFQGLLHG